MRFSVAESLPKPWRNGQGETREFAVRHEEDHLLWRLSLAEIGQDGAFSKFEGLNRILTVVEGDGLLLCDGVRGLEARPQVPLEFDGAWSLHCRLPKGHCRAFNVIYDPLWVQASVRAVGPGSVRVGGAATTAIFQIAGQANFGHHGGLRAGEGLILHHEPTLGDLAPDSAALVIDLDDLTAPQSVASKSAMAHL